MTLVSLSFEVHQPIRLKKNFFWDGYMNRQVVPDLWKYYFDDPENQRIFERVSDKCYLPANRAILEGIKSSRDRIDPSRSPTASQASSWRNAKGTARMC